MLISSMPCISKYKCIIYLTEIFIINETVLISILHTKNFYSLHQNDGSYYNDFTIDILISWLQSNFNCSTDVVTGAYSQSVQNNAHETTVLAELICE